MEPVELRTDDLVLRFWQPSDAAAVHRACRHPGLRRWAGDVSWRVCLGRGAPDHPMAFRRVGLRRVQWRAEVGDEASRRVAEKAGYEMEGLLRQRLAVGGRRCDCWVGSALSRDRVAA